MFSVNKLPSINAVELKQKLDNGEDITILDVRTQREWYETGIIEGSMTIPMDQLGMELQNGLFQKHEKPIIIVCRSGSRSSGVTQYMVKQLNMNAINLTGGLGSWYQNGGKLIPPTN